MTREVIYIKSCSSSVNKAFVPSLPNIRVFFQEDFFIVLHNILSEMEEVTELQPVPDAHVPVMKFKFQGISIDLLYASISLLVVPEVSLYYSFLAFICFLPFYCIEDDNASSYL